MHGAVATLEHLLIPIDTLLPHPQNPREHDEDVIRESLILNGQYGPVIVQASTRRLLAGHGTWAAALSLGWTEIAAVLLDVDDEQALRVLLADNRVNEAGDNDPEALLALLRDLDGQFAGTGYTHADFSELMTVVEANTLADGPPLTDPEAGGDGMPAPPATTPDLRSLVLSYDTAQFESVVGWLMKLKAHEGDTFTGIVQRVVGDALLRSTP